jgi:hypothetical protein
LESFWSKCGRGGLAGGSVFSISQRISASVFYQLPFQGSIIPDLSLYIMIADFIYTMGADDLGKFF